MTKSAQFIVEAMKSKKEYIRRGYTDEEAEIDAIYANMKKYGISPVKWERHFPNINRVFIPGLIFHTAKYFLVK